MHDGVFGSAGVLVDGRPAIDQRAIDRAFLSSRRQVPEPVPRRVDEGVHGVGLAPGRLAVDRAGNVKKRLVASQRIHPAAGVVDRLRKEDGQVFVWDRHDPMGRAVDDRDGRPPVALPAEQPVAKAVGDRGFRPAALRQLGDDRLAALVRQQPIEAPAVDQMLIRGVGDERAIHRRVGGLARRGDDSPDLEPEPLGELVVALIVGGHGHDRAGAVAGQDVVGDPDRDALAVDRVDGIGAEIDAGLLAIGREPVDLGPPAGLLDVGIHLGAPVGRCQGRDQRMLRGEDHERRAEQRVRSGREDAQPVAARLVVIGCDLEVDLGAFGSADPVRLLEADRLGPVDAREIEQLVGVFRRSQVPLLEVALLDWRAASPAVAVGPFDLLAGERAVIGTPVDRRHPAIGKAGLQEAEEHPLVPAVEPGIAGDDLVAPVEHCAHRPELLPLVLDVLHRPVAWIDVVLDRGILGRQAVGIEADREEDVVAVHPSEAGERVGGRDDVPVADVQVARRVGVHRQDVGLGTGLVVEIRLVEPELLPARLPARLDRGRIVAFDPRSSLGRVAGFGGVGHVGSSETDHPPPRRRGVGLGRLVAVGGATGTRTPDPLHAMQVLFQLSYSPTGCGV